MIPAPDDSPTCRPRLTVAVLVVRDGKLLFVEEVAGGTAVLNQPAGHVEHGETVAQAALREAREETGWDVELTHLVGAYRWRAPDGTDFLRLAYAARPLRHDATRTLDPDILRTLWLSPAQLRAQAGRLRSPLVLACVEDWCAGQRLPLSLLREVA